MPEVFVAAGSNVAPERHLGAALRALAERFGVLRISPVYRNPPHSEAASLPPDAAGGEFLNMVLAFDTGEPVEAVAAELSAIEAANGRGAAPARSGPCTLDLDLLLYGDLVMETEAVRVPRADIIRHPFVLRPLAELAGERRHPVLGTTYGELWAAWSGPAHPMVQETVDFTAEGQA